MRFALRILLQFTLVLTLALPVAGQIIHTFPPADSPYWWTLTDDITPEELRAIHLDWEGNQKRRLEAVQIGASMDPSLKNLTADVDIFISGEVTPYFHRFAEVLYHFAGRADIRRDVVDTELSEYGISIAGREVILDLAARALQTDLDLSQDLADKTIEFNRVLETLSNATTAAEYRTLLREWNLDQIAKHVGKKPDEIQDAADAWLTDIDAVVYSAAARDIKQSLPEDDWKNLRTYFLKELAPRINEVHSSDETEYFDLVGKERLDDDKTRRPNKAKPVQGDWVIDDVFINSVDSGPTRLSVETYGVARYRGKTRDMHTEHCLIMFANQNQDGSNDLSIAPSFSYGHQSPDVIGNHVFIAPSQLIRGTRMSCVPGGSADCRAFLSLEHCNSKGKQTQFRGGASVFQGACVQGDFQVTHQVTDYTEIEETTCGVNLGGRVEGLEKGQSVTLLATIRDGILGEVVNTDAVTVTRGKGKYTGQFQFSDQVQSGFYYNITTHTQPAGGPKCGIHPDTKRGLVGGYDIDDILVKCVTPCHATRSVVPPPGDFSDAEAVGCTMNTQFELLPDQTVADYGNNLVWMYDFHVDSFGSAFTDRDKAASACSSLDRYGRDDWRLPDIAQLRTLLPDCGGGILKNCFGDNVYALHGETGGAYCDTSDLLLPVSTLSNSISSDASCTGGGWYSCIWKAQLEPVCEKTRQEEPIFSERPIYKGYFRCVAPLYGE